MRMTIIGPSRFDSVENGIYAMENSLSSYGAAGPAQFNVSTTPLPFTDNFVTGFQSWLAGCRVRCRRAWESGLLCDPDQRQREFD